MLLRYPGANQLHISLNELLDLLVSVSLLLV